MAISCLFFQNFKLKILAWKLQIFVVEILIVDMLDVRLETTYGHHKSNQDKSWVSNPRFWHTLVPKEKKKISS
jgi:hypothetical protein